MPEALGGNLRREAGGCVWFEPLEPLAGIARLVMTTRAGGLSRPPYDSLNLGSHVGDVPERVRLNRLSVQKILGRGLRDPVVAEQVHGTRAAVVGELHAGTRWQQPEKSLASTDALVTAAPRLPLVTLVADCVPVALVDPVRQVASVVHAGWRGAAAGVLESSLAAMKHTWGTLPEDVTAWIGPAIGPCCYEVGAEVFENFAADSQPAGPGKARLDLAAAVRRRLTAAGLLEENLTGLSLCTACHPDLFFSHRRATREGQSAAGRQALILWLEKSP